MNIDPTLTASLRDASSVDELCRCLDRAAMKNGWNKPRPSLYPEPKREFELAHWAYVYAHAALEAAGRHVSTENAERRNLIMANPIPGNDYATVKTLVGAYQMVKAGETARSHRHTPNAMRIVLEAGPRTFTIVDGKRVPMLPGDVLLTPNGSWHGHSNESDSDSYWIDILDAPLVQLLGPMFLEHATDPVNASAPVDPSSPMRMARSAYEPALRMQEPTYPGVRILELCAGRIETFDRVALLLDAGTSLQLNRTTASSILVPLRGSGRLESSEKSFDWTHGDLLALPSWTDAVLSSVDEALLIKVSDAPMLAKLCWLRTVSGSSV